MSDSIARATVSGILVDEFPSVTSEGDWALNNLAVLANPSSTRLVDVTDTE